MVIYQKQKQKKKGRDELISEYLSVQLYLHLTCGNSAGGPRITKRNLSFRLASYNEFEDLHR